MRLVEYFIKRRIDRVKATFTQLILLMLLLLAQFSCKKLVEVDPPSNSLTSDNIYSNDATAASVLTGVYTNLSSAAVLSGENLKSISIASALSADEMNLYGGASNVNITLAQFYQNKLSSGLPGTKPNTIWGNCYANLYTINLAIERLNVSQSLTPAVKQQLMGEAKFLRAFFYFYLVNLYGDAPLTMSSDYNLNAKLSRSDKNLIYDQVIKDLKESIDLLDGNYKAADAKTNTTERLRPNKWSAVALLSRVYLYKGDWANAELQSTAIINNNSQYDTVSLNNVFLKNSKEAIWQLQPVNTGWNTEEAKALILPSSGPTSNSSTEGYPVYLSNQLLNGFESGDKRKSTWVNNVVVNTATGSASYYYAYKYKSATINAPLTEYSMVFRLGEQYLIRSEARAHLGKVSEALKDLNVIRKRAGLPDASTTDQNSLLNLIYHERQVELFTEWGHRWLDLKRTGKLDEVMSNVAPAKGTTWNSNWAFYPIPLYDITQNPSLTQNSGY